MSKNKKMFIQQMPKEEFQFIMIKIVLITVRNINGMYSHQFSNKNSQF